MTDYDKPKARELIDAARERMLRPGRWKGNLHTVPCPACRGRGCDCEWCSWDGEVTPFKAGLIRAERMRVRVEAANEQ